MSVEWKTTAVLFPGQGSQKVGMGKELASAYPIVAETFAEADSILGYNLTQLCFEGPEETLNETLHTQPALFVAGVAAWRALVQKLGSEPQPGFAAGHSLGEFTALVAAGALAFEDGLRLVRRRAELMKEAGEKSPGAVAALLGLEIDAVRELCADASAASGETVVVANDNCPGQIVISGSSAALDQALGLATERGAKRAVKLAVSVAVHSPLMKPAGEAFAQAVEATPIQDPKIPIVGNVTATSLTTADAIREELKAQITASVLWRPSIELMLAQGINTFIELGTGDVLIGLVKRISRDATRINIENPTQLENFVSA
jgi:[acyl-carrier-protein] S-malonyltransferase